MEWTDVAQNKDWWRTLTFHQRLGISWPAETTIFSRTVLHEANQLLANWGTLTAQNLHMVSLRMHCFLASDYSPRNSFTELRTPH
jgi:hypothetical protein